MDRLPKSHVALVLQVRARLQSRRPASAPPPEHQPKDVFEAARAARARILRPATRASAEEIRKVEPLKIDGYFLPAASCSIATAGEASETSRSVAAPAPARIGFRGRRVDVVGIEADL